MGGKIPHIGITVECAKTALSCIEYYLDMEGDSKEERHAKKELTAKLKYVKK
jgi:hypothetical protein